MNERQNALVGYFYTLAKDPRIKAAFASRSATKIRDTFLSCVGEDLPAAMAFVAQSGIFFIAPKMKAVAKATTATVLRGQVPEKVADGVVETVGALMDEGFSLLGRLVDRAATGGRRK